MKRTKAPKGVGREECLTLLSIAMIKHRDRKQLGLEKVKLAHSSTSQCAIDGSQAGTGKQELKQEPRSNAVLACSSWLVQPHLLHHQDHLPQLVRPPRAGFSGINH